MVRNSSRMQSSGFCGIPVGVTEFYIHLEFVWHRAKEMEIIVNMDPFWLGLHLELVSNNTRPRG